MNDRELAIEYLNAEKMLDGDWRYLDHPSRLWYVVDSNDLELLGVMLRDEVPEAYSHWCTQTDDVISQNQTGI